MDEPKEMALNEKLVTRMISTALHMKYEDIYATSKDEILVEAIAIKNAFKDLCPVTDKQWQNVLVDVGSYADSLI